MLNDDGLLNVALVHDIPVRDIASSDLADIVSIMAGDAVDLKGELSQLFA